MTAYIRTPKWRRCPCCFMEFREGYPKVKNKYTQEICAECRALVKKEYKNFVERVKELGYGEFI